MTPTNIAGGASTVRRNVLILAICQALSMSGGALVMTVSALAGQIVAMDMSLATVPLAMQFTATMLSTIPASLLMGRIGRRAGFTIGQVIGLLGAGLACWALFAAVAVGLLAECVFWALATICMLGVDELARDAVAAGPC